MFMETVTSTITGQGSARTTEALVATIPAGVLEHACRKPEFNAMVDTCPQCAVPDTDGVRVEADGRPYRHVVASRWLVHALLQYHYLPYWPRNVDQVFATVDIRTGRVVAACVFAYPVLRCFLREQVFGQLSPDTLNRDFRQLVRWMVHPDHRAEKVGTELLRWALTKMEQPVVEAINRSWVPVKAFQELGMIERSDGERHYYYRLKECRKREDEIAHPPTQTQAAQGEVLHAYPRVWRPKLHLEGSAQFVFVQPYEGSPLRTHAWHGQSYTVLYDPQITLEKLEKSDAMQEVHDPDKRTGLLNRIAGGLPVMNRG
jgi:hypothetical protein